MKLSELKINPNNPQTFHDLSKLENSIKEFPKMMSLRPLVYDPKNMQMLGGNKRLICLQNLGFKEIPDNWVKSADELTPEEKKRFILADNIGFGEWDWDVLESDFSECELEEWGLELPNDFDVNTEAQEDDYEIPDEIETDIVLGDLIEIGRHRLLCGDSTDKEQVGRLMNGEKADISFTSPPYNLGKMTILRAGKGFKNIKKSLYGSSDDNLKNEEYSYLLRDSLKNSLLFSSGVVYNVQTLANNKIDILNWIIEYKDNFNDIITWEKPTGTPYGLNSILTPVYEWLVIFSDKNNRVIPMASWKGNISSIYKGDNQNNNEFKNVHNATFPIHLPTFVISKLMDESRSVLDLFLGNGTTMVAAHQLNRKCYGMELAPKYCQVIIDRMLKLDPDLEVKINSKEYIKINEN